MDAHSGQAAWAQAAASLATLAVAVAAAIYARQAALENQRSADTAERALADIERPFLVVRVGDPGISVSPGSISYDVTKYRFHNFGRVPALLTEYHFEIQHADVMPPAIDPLAQEGRQLAHGAVVGGGEESEEHETSRALPLTSRLLRGAIAANDPKIFFLGFVKYRDLAGRRYVTGFCFRYGGEEAGYQPISYSVRGGDDPYNYDKRIG